MEIVKKEMHFKGFGENGWFVQSTSDYKITENEQYVTSKGMFSPVSDKYSIKQAFDTLEEAEKSITDNHKGDIEHFN